MSSQRAAELQAVLEGITLPATREELIAYAHRYDVDAGTQLARIPDRSYDSLDDVGEALVRTQPAAPATKLVPARESGLPPGGNDYLNAHPEPGAVRR